MKACIVVGTYFSPGQTFVNRHIDLLFGGNTCVVSDRINDLRPVDGRFAARFPDGSREKGGLFSAFGDLGRHIRHGSKSAPDAAERRRLVAFLEDQRPDVILSEFGPQGVAFAPVANAARIPMYCYFRGSDASSRVRHSHVRRAYRLMMPRLAGIFGVSRFLIDNLAASGVAHPNTHVVPSGVDLERFRPGEKRPGACLSVGRFVEKKAPLETIRAFGRAARDVPHATLTMVGDGELLEPARALVSELGLADRVSLPGALPHDRVRDLLGESEVFLQHSVVARNGNTEGLPTAIQEAMAAGCITVSTRHAGIPEAVDEGETGFLCDEHDYDTYTENAHRALTLDAVTRATMAGRARDVAAERFDADRSLARVEAELRRGAGG